MDEDDTKSHRAVPAATRAIAILRLLGRSDIPLGINNIARELDLIPSTCLHILRVLVAEELVRFDPETKRYDLGLGLLSMARSVISRNDFASILQPHLTELSNRFDCTSLGVQTSGHSMVVVALSQALLPFRLQVDLGSRFPGLISASGRLFAHHSGLSDAALKSGFGKLIWDNPPSYEEWKSQVDQAGEQGYGIDRGQYISGVTILAVPFFAHSGQMTQAMVTIGITDRLERMDVDKIIEEMLRLRDLASQTMLSIAPPAAAPRGRKKAQ